MDTSLPYAYFRHHDGSWYRLWMTGSQPRTERGHPWHVHASYDKSGTLAPVAGTRWYEEPYGMANWDFASFETALADFQKRCAERLARGYELREGAIPATEQGDHKGDEWSVS